MLMTVEIDVDNDRTGRVNLNVNMTVEIDLDDNRIVKNNSYMSLN